MTKAHQTQKSSFKQYFLDGDWSILNTFLTQNVIMKESVQSLVKCSRLLRPPTLYGPLPFHCTYNNTRRRGVEAVVFHALDSTYIRATFEGIINVMKPHLLCIHAFVHSRSVGVWSGQKWVNKLSCHSIGSHKVGNVRR